ncbi:TonB-dependent receptor [Sphingomonas bacterium]|uniref:TonB-dependent receptor n=1 Tax=Sphingomonas bacterium TaxID=1895847 RepID=UPI0020C697A1|nr:TonB-dependent receptor [Sphingomonas bacterium]
MEHRITAAPGSSSLLALSCIGFIASAPATAQTPPQPAAPPRENGVELQGVTVTDTAIDSASYKPEAVNPKLTAPLLDTPRSIVVIGEQVIKDTGSATLVDALRTVPGITFGAAEGGNPIGDRPFIRGFDSQGSTYVDGVRSIGAQTREVFAIEQVQVVRGSDSTLGGRGSAGGTINIVSKLPQADSFYRADGSYGTADYKRATADANVALSPIAAIRIAAMWHDQDVAGRDAIFQKRWGVAPSATIGLGTPTRLTAAYYHLHTNELPDSGLPYTYVCSATVCNAPAGYVLDEPVHHVTTLGGQTGTVSRNTFYGLKDRDFRRSNQDQATLRVEHDFGRRITLRNTARFDHTWQGYSFLLPDDSTGNVVGTTTTNATVGGVTNFTNGGYVWRRANTRQGITNSFSDQLDLTAKLRTGPLRHSIATGLEWSEERARRGTYVIATGSTISPRCNSNTIARYYCTSLFNPNPNDPFVNYTSDTSTVATPIVKSAPYADTINEGFTKAAYLFDSISMLDERLIVNLGARYDNFRSKVQPGLASATAGRFSLSRTNNVWTYQAGAVFKPTKNSSLYATFATSATPPNSLLGEGSEPNALGTTNTAQALALLDQLKVERSKTYEVGAKIDLFDGRLALTGDIFRTETTNARVTIDANTVAFIGKRRSQGGEIGFNGNITKDWTVFGGYSYLDAKIRDGGQSALTAAAVGARAAQTVYVDSVNTGRQFPQTAKHNFTIWTNYSFAKRFSLGGGAFYSSRVFGGYSDNRTATQNAAGVVTITPATTVIARSVPGYWRLDARAGVKITSKLNLSVNVNNLTNKRYFSQAYSSHYATIAPGRSAFGTLSFAY